MRRLLSVVPALLAWTGSAASPIIPLNAGEESVRLFACQLKGAGAAELLYYPASRRFTARIGGRVETFAEAGQELRFATKGWGTTLMLGSGARRLNIAYDQGVFDGVSGAVGRGEGRRVAWRDCITRSIRFIDEANPRPREDRRYALPRLIDNGITHAQAF